jgi:hypothetical protein
LIGGAGNDTLALTGSNADWLKTNGGDDRVVLSGVGSFSAIALGAGADELVIEAATATRISLGDGHDKVSASTIVFATAGSLIGGAGRDTIDLTIGGNSNASAFINGGKAQDLITVNGLDSNSTVKGMSGADTITISGDGATTAVIAAGADADLVTISGVSDGTVVRGGSGNDNIVFADNSNGESASIFGGSDNDSIHFDGIAETNDYSDKAIAGGLGADSITFSAAAAAGNSGTTLGTLSYSSFSESNLTTTDVIDVIGTSSGSMVLAIDFTDDMKATTVGEVSAAVLVSDADFSGGIANNIVTLSGSTFNVSSVTAVAGTVDTLTLGGGKGAAVLFSTSSGADYIFVQGGAAGVTDDSVISIGQLSGGAAPTVAVNTSMTITFSGMV